MSSVSLRLPAEVSERLASLAERTGKSATYYMIEAIKLHIEELEDIYDVEKTLFDVREGREKTIPYEEVRKECGLDSYGKRFAHKEK